MTNTEKIILDKLNAFEDKHKALANTILMGHDNFRTFKYELSTESLGATNGSALGDLKNLPEKYQNLPIYLVPGLEGIKIALMEE